MKPNNSITIPIKVQPDKTVKIPPRKQIVPLTCRVWKRNLRVLLGPMTTVTPTKNRTFPKVRNARSKKRRIPSNEKKTPKPVNKAPISETVSYCTDRRVHDCRIH
eukprot:TRINITY_DN10985_c2_g1_i2.p2 TRINITY_DN10985_c2_g1~~TRINITY_DN10985_c2_g1_i2.p2  ORF type:complete len:105 (-),score=10.37 TRINITY_DN10985_c2_g1_i2:131-445(-)